MSDKNFIKKISLFIRKLKFLRYKLKVQNDVTIICNNCTGGIMYSDLGLQFMSPTINLYFGEHGDYFHFVLNLKQYCENGKLFKSSISEKKENFLNSPVAILKCKDLKDIEIHFLHYKSFEEAKNKWFQRVKRINFEKIFLVIEAQSDYEKSMIPNYLKLKYPMIIFTDTPCDFPSCRLMPFYSKYGTGENHPILKLVSPFGKRGYDDFDFVGEIFLRKY